MPTPFQKSFADLPPSDLAIGSVFGLRSFSVRDGVLYGSQSIPWYVNDMKAVCLNNDCPTVPNDTCECGIYAYWSTEEDLNNGNVIAVVEGTGTTLLGTKGFRTANAKIVALAHPLFKESEWEKIPLTGTHTIELDDRTGEYALVAIRYRVPMFDTLHDMIKEFPPTQEYYKPSDS